MSSIMQLDEEKFKELITGIRKKGPHIPVTQTSATPPKRRGRPAKEKVSRIGVEGTKSLKEARIDLPATTVIKTKKGKQTGPLSTITTGADVEAAAKLAEETHKLQRELNHKIDAVEQYDQAVATKTLADQAPTVASVQNLSKELQELRDSMAAQLAGRPGNLTAEQIQQLVEGAIMNIANQERAKQEEVEPEDNVAAEEAEIPPLDLEEVAESAVAKSITELSGFADKNAKKKEGADDRIVPTTRKSGNYPDNKWFHLKKEGSRTARYEIGVDPEGEVRVFKDGKVQATKMPRSVPLTNSVLQVLTMVGVDNNKAVNHYKPAHGDVAATDMLRALTKMGWINWVNDPANKPGGKKGKGMFDSTEEERPLIDDLGDLTKKRPAKKTHYLDEEAYMNGIIKIMPIDGVKDGVKPNGKGVKADYVQSLHPDTKALLEGKFQPGKKYAEEAIKQFRTLHAFMPRQYARGTGKYNMLRGKPHKERARRPTIRKNGIVHVMSNDPDDWAERVTTNLGLIAGGNTSLDLQNETSQIIDLLAKHGHITADEAYALHQKVE